MARLEPPGPQRSLPVPPFHRWVQADGTVSMAAYRTAEGHLLRFPHLADFRLAADGTVTCQPVPGLSDDLRDHLLVNQVWPLRMSGLGWPVFHASTVEMGEGAVAFPGPSGRGKSTLAAAFAAAGARYLGDDVLVLDLEHGCIARPAPPAIRLREGSRRRFAERAAPDPTGKATLTQGHCPEPRPLLAAFFLEDRGATSVEVAPLGGAAACGAWVGCSFLLDVDDPATLRRNFGQVGRILARVPAFSLDFPRDLDRLPEVLAAVATTVERRAAA